VILCQHRNVGRYAYSGFITLCYEYGILQDVQWNDIEYMKLHLDWTYDDVAFHDLPDIVKDLNDHSQKYVIVVVCSLILLYNCLLFK